MIQIRPTSDLQDNFNSMEKAILEDGQTIYLTKDGYGSLVMMSLENYSKLKENQGDNNQEQDYQKKGHIEIISKSKKLSDEDDE